MDDLTPIEKSWQPKLNVIPIAGCLDADILIQIAEFGRKAAGYDAAMLHIAECPCCRQTLKELKALGATAPKPVRKSIWLYWLLPAAGVAAAALAIFAILSTLNAPKTVPTPSIAHKPVIAPEPNRLLDPSPDKVKDRVIEPPTPPTLTAKNPPKRRLRRSAPPKITAPPREIDVPAETIPAAPLDAWSSSEGQMEGEVLANSNIGGEVFSGTEVIGHVVGKLPPP